MATRPPRQLPPASPCDPAADVAIIGAGIIGCALARELALGGARVTLLDRGDPGGEASAAAAGMLGPQAECDAPNALFVLGIASRALYPATVEALHEETGLDPEYQRDGIVYVALSAEEEAVLARRHAWQAASGHRVERLDARDVRRLAPALADDIRSGLLFPDDHRIDNVRLTRAYALACARLGVRLRRGFPVHAIRHERDRVSGVEGGGEVVRAGTVVNAAGAWASQVEPHGGGLPVRPVRGQMALLAGPDQAFRHAIYSHDVYLVPRRDGRVLVGSTYEEVGFDKRVTADAVSRMLTRALRLAPALTDATFREAWAGLRPGTPDRLPILGPDPRIAGLYHASGHYRSGILLAPATARDLAALILEGRWRDELAPFSPARFAGLSPDRAGVDGQRPSSRNR